MSAEDLQASAKLRLDRSAGSTLATGGIQQGEFADRQGVAVVTGGTGAIGAGVCRLLTDRGSRVAFVYRNSQAAADELLGAAATQGKEMVARQLDLTDERATRELGAELAERFGGVHTFVHAAGPHVKQMHLSTVPPAKFHQHLMQETGAFFNVAHALIGSLRAEAGSIVAVTTVATRRYPPRDGLSSGPKASIEAVVRGLAAEEGKFGVRANCVGPGVLTDGMTERLVASDEFDERASSAALARIPLRRFGCAADIAELVCFLASDRAGYITGQAIDVDGGYSL